MGTTALVISISYSVLVVAGIVLAVLLARSTRARRHEVNTEKLARREKTWLGIVVVLLVVLLFGTIFFIPYGESATGDRQVVRVEASQFAWTIDPPEVTAGIPVEFQLTSSDVNHGFGVYNSNDVLLFQVQVIPGDLQETVYTFEEPGRYEILCLEFCGFFHHGMVGELTVNPA
jgi:cytochrome c oxidase subunit 2